MHEIAIIAMHGFVAADLATPLEVFGRVRLADGGAGYRVRVCGEAREVRGEAFAIKAPGTLADVASATTLIVPGVADPSAPVSHKVVAAVRDAAANGARVASVCTGAFILAAAGLLDGRRATTHWRAAPGLAARYPAVTVLPDVLFVDEGKVVTSAGASAALDMCLHLVRRDHGQAVAARSGRLAVAPLDRAGGQAQFIRHEPPQSHASLAALLAWIEAHAASPLTLDDMAKQGGTSTRTLSRRFKAQTGVSPGQWLIGARTRRAQQLLETTDLSIEMVAAEAGFAARRPSATGSGAMSA